MDNRGWRPARTVQVVLVDGEGATSFVGVSTGLIDTTGGPQIGLRIGDRAEVILPPGAASGLIVDLRHAIAEKMRETS